MKKVRFAGLIILLAMATSIMADARPGTSRRDFKGRTYYYEPITYYSPVWYSGNGIIATKKLPGVPLWPNGHFNVVYK